MNKIWLDFDGVITDTVAAICDCYNEDFQYYSEYKRIYPWNINSWNFDECSLAAKEQIDAYFCQPRFFKKLKFMNEAAWYINSLIDYGYDVEIVSMCTEPNMLGKKIWLEKHLPDIKFTGVKFREYPDKSHIDMSGGVLIDDSYSNLITSTADLNICFGEILSWNKDWSGTRARTWREVKKIIEEVTLNARF